MTPVLSARGITKEFPGVVALKDVSFDVQPGEIHALCGENGAGKSTLIKLLCGVHPSGSYSGRLLVDGRDAAFASVADAEAAGIAAICQELALVPEMSVAENVFLGAEPRLRGLIDWETVHRETRAWLDRFGLAVDPRAPTKTLGTGQRQMVEIVKALRKRSRVLILDEPTAALSESEVERLLARLKELRREGLSCIYISHRLDEVLAVADRVTVLRDGVSVASFPAAGAAKGEIIRHMVGREIQDLFPRRAVRPGEVLLEVRGLCADGPGLSLSEVSFQARAGEVLGIGGLMGAGRSELLRHLFGAWGLRRGGEALIAGRPLPPTPRGCLAAGLALVSEDRKKDGLVLEQSVGFNLSLASLERHRRGGLIDAGAERRESLARFSSLKVKAPGLEAPVGKLSGGNQQKVVLGKVLSAEPRVVLLDEPTRGIDVGAKVEVYELINRLTEEGRAVVLVSSELPELLGMSDRILILREGAVAGEFPRAQANQERLLSAAMGHCEAAA